VQQEVGSGAWVIPIAGEGAGAVCDAYKNEMSYRIDFTAIEMIEPYT